MFLLLLLACGEPAIDLTDPLVCQSTTEPASVHMGDVLWPDGPSPCAEGPRAIAGHVMVSGDVSSLAELSCICAVAGDLQVNEVTGLKSLGELSALEEVRGTFRVVNNTSLDSIGELPELREIGQSLIVEYNEELQTIDGMDALTDVGGDVRVRFNPLMEAVGGLNNLQNVGGRILIDYERDRKGLMDWVRDALTGDAGPRGRSGVSALPPWARVLGVILLIFMFAFGGIAIGFRAVDRAGDWNDPRLANLGPVGEEMFAHLRFDEVERQEPREYPPALDYVPEHKLAEARQFLKLLTVNLGDRVLRAGAEDTAAAWLVEGELEVHVGGRDVGTIGVNGVAGEMAMFEQATHGADVVGAMETRLVVLTRNNYVSLCRLGNPAAMLFEQSIIAGQGAQLRTIRKRLIAQAQEVRVVREETDRQKILDDTRALMAELPERVASGGYDPYTVLSKIPAFDHFGEEELSLLNSRVEVREIPAGEAVFVQSLRSVNLFIAVKGEAGLFMCVQQGDEPVRVGTVQPLDVFGTASFLPSRPHEVSCISLTDMTVLALNRRPAEWLIGLDAPVGRNFRIGLIRALNATFREANAQVLGKGQGHPQAEWTGDARQVFHRELPPEDEAEPAEAPEA